MCCPPVFAGFSLKEYMHARGVNWIDGIFLGEDYSIVATHDAMTDALLRR